MPVSPDTAQSLIKELYLIGRAIRIALLHPEEGQLLPGGIGVLGTLESKGPCRQVDLAVDLCISASALSRHVTELVGAGYISRHADPSDGRATLIRVTDEGRDLLGRVRASRARGLQTALADWSEDEAEQACESVRKLRNSLATHAQHAGTAHPQPVSKESQGADV
ncbi:MarR family winged helix-turn-helix transcriptional regulator [Nocardia bhagyanarayanae]|uniref:MarR family transcriptional regulator n=1 Tax=Nocardia bhagyanarayanae TaxID=1215925 RepID=A0A543FDU0_9NOCA|nr:MarR family transcriptional regulator [Nocardia bhagyanarayanae]TQM32055.1 MarR family transcriptional regulator [Nocardia bhagyanarayanae]